MTSIDFLNKVHKNLDSQEYNLSFSPAKSKNFMLYCNGNFIGGLFDEELCFVYAGSVSELLGQPEPVYRGYSSTAQHRMLVIPEEYWAKALKLLYAEKFDWSRLVYDICLSESGCRCWAGAVPSVCRQGQQRLYALGCRPHTGRLLPDEGGRRF